MMRERTKRLQQLRHVRGKKNRQKYDRKKDAEMNIKELEEVGKFSLVGVM